MGPFVSLKKQAEILFRLICCERKTLFQLKNTGYKRNEHDHYGAAINDVDMTTYYGAAISGPCI